MAAADFSQTAHRPYPHPRSPWAMRMVWHDLLFAHWPVPAASLRPHIPADLEIDTFTGAGGSDQAFLGVIPFRMTGVCARLCPPVPSVHRFVELNVRTYVRGPDGRPGVWFFSLDAASPLAVEVARATYRLPYQRARMHCRSADEGWIDYRSHRTDRRTPSALFEARYRPTGAAARSGTGTLEHFLTERYCLYAPGRRAGACCRAEIHHAPWPLQPAEARITANTMAAALGIDLAGPGPAPPLLHFARRLEVVAWPPRRIGASARSAVTTR